MSDEDISCVYGLRSQARCLTAVPSTNYRSKFLVGTQGLKRDNEVHLLEFDDDAFQITSKTFRHPNEVWDIAACPVKDDLFFTVHSPISSNTGFKRNATLWRPQINSLEENSNTGETRDQADLEQVLVLEMTDARKVLWDSKSSLKAASIHNRTLCIWDLEDGVSAGNLSDTIVIPSAVATDSSTFLTNAVWNPHSPEIATINNGEARGWDIRSKSETFAILAAHDGVPIRAFDCNPNKPFNFATGGDDGRVRFWDVRNGGKEMLKEIRDHTHWIWSIAYNRDHDQLLLSSGSDNLVNLHSIVSTSSAAIYKSRNRRNETDSDSGSESEGDVSLVDSLVSTYDQHEDSVYAVAWSYADIWVFASLSYDGRVVINHVPKEEKFRIMGV